MPACPSATASRFSCSPLFDFSRLHSPCPIFRSNSPSLAEIACVLQPVSGTQPPAGVELKFYTDQLEALKGEV